MVVLEEKVKPGGGLIAGAHVYVEEMKLLKEMQDHNTSKKAIHSELWHACAGPLVTLPQVGSLVYYFPQGHSEQVAVSTNRFNTTSQIQNYPNLPSQLLCQVHNVTFNADKDTDEVFAQMSLQPVNSEKDVLPMPDFGLNRNKHPTEFFCKTLTASDTSTHGGFSVPRRAAEKLFPQLDYAMQPPTQELIVKDLHENTWTFRHIYRGQPKRHLLTTGWSMFVGSKRLRAGDLVLFIRDERSHLMIGVRRENLKKSTLPSSLLSADSMHLGLLAAAAHAAINRSSFSIFYNPRACPSDFVISMEKYRKSLYNTQISPGTRFGKMFETEESTKRRYMGMVVGISDLDPVRWPGSKWRNIQVEWDERVSGNKHNRISPWEIETPESLFIFSPLTTGLKIPFESTFSGAQTEWENMVHKQFVRVQENVNCGLVSHMPSISQSSLIEPPELINKLVNPIRFDPSEMPASEFARLEPVLQSNQFSQCTDGGLVVKEATSSHDLSSEMRFMNNSNQLLMQMNPNIMQIQLDACFVYPLNDKMPQSQHLSENGIFTQNGIFEYRSTFQSTGFSSVLEKHENPNLFPGCVGPDVSVTEEMWMNQLNNAKCPNANDIYSYLNFDGSNSSSTVVDPSISSTTLDEFSTLKDDDFNNPSDFHLTNFTSSQDVQSQITSASLATDSHGFSFQEFADNSGGASSSNVIDLDESHPMPNTPWKQTAPRIRTYTKIQKAGSVGRSIDVSRFKNYNELCSAIECMFGLEGLLLLNDSKYSGWKLVYVDYENDVLLVGDDPWEGFVRCVRCIRILSPSEVQQMSEEGMQLLNLVSEAGSLL